MSVFDALTIYNQRLLVSLVASLSSSYTNHVNSLMRYHHQLKFKFLLSSVLLRLLFVPKKP